MTDMSLRLPTRRFRAVFALGTRHAATLPLPTSLGKPNLFGEWDDETELSSLYVGFGTGQVHLDAVDGGAEHHFHDAAGDDTDTSPWGPGDTAQVVAWATALLTDLQALMPDLIDDVDDAAAWHDAGLDLWVCEVEEPTHLDLVEVDIEGELLTLPWLGAGHVEHDHVDEAPDDVREHPIALLWAADEHRTPDQPIAEAWLTPGTEQTVTRALPGVDWAAVGMPADEVLPWLEGIYLNHHVLPDPAGTILTGVLERLGGIDGID
ncbi:hypothetical protein [Frigoribacterium sp. VKM Ac-2530]|uniref:hypothetical protein n=1 Tax=Frigoribacterium sp. VKM Ac-2530 TaxID=2783822 RepID=UPI00188B2566|nr:hypothetical protein [Frigoribacterium sp. VKM Ac-2530]MBF4579224.1 hypothetical protein [Frigoribacterium sp. VKM Ac-2530]